MNKNKSSFHMGDEINGYSQQVYWIAEEIDLPNLSQENVRLRLNFNKFLQKLIYSTPAINDPNNMNPTMLKLLGAQTGVRQVIFSENNNTAKNTSGDTIIYIAGEGTTKTASLSVQTASSTPTDQSFLKRTSGNDNRKQNNKNKSGWYPDGHGCWQFFRNNVPVCGEWIKDEGKWYYTSQEGYMVTGLVTINDHQYFFRSNGEMAYRWRKISDYWFYFHKTEGYMRTNRWIDDPNEWYYVDDVGHMVTGWKKIEDKWYYFDEKGKMVTGKKEIMGRNYSFNEDGSKSGNLPPLYKLDDFYFPIPEESSGYWEDQNYAANLMYLHQQYHGLITEKQKEYVSKKAILGCTKGTKLTRLDSTKAVNVSYLTDGSPVLGCTDCKVGENIHSFESCRATLDDCIGLPLTEKMSDGFQKCIPLVEESWKQDNANTPRICHDNTYTYKYALKKDAILICKYKGIIGILEVPEDEIEGADKKKVELAPWLFGYSGQPETSGGRDVTYSSTDRQQLKNIPGVLGIDWYSYENQSGPNKYTSPHLTGRDFDNTKYGEGELIDENERYWVTLGPKVLIPNYSDEGQLLTSEFAALGLIGCRVDVVLRNTKAADGDEKYVYIECVWSGNIKAHTFNNGVYQTGHPYKNSDSAKTEPYKVDYVDGSIVEFTGMEPSTNGTMSDYVVEKLIVY